MTAPRGPRAADVVDGKRRPIVTLADTLIRTRPILRRRERRRTWRAIRRDFAWPFLWSVAALSGPAILWLWSLQ